jgi:hypothetical protein
MIRGVPDAVGTRYDLALDYVRAERAVHEQVIETHARRIRRKRETMLTRVQSAPTVNPTCVPQLTDDGPRD